MLGGAAKAQAAPIVVGDPFALHLSWVNCYPCNGITLARPGDFTLELDVVLTPSIGTYVFPNLGAQVMRVNAVTQLSGHFNGHALSLASSYGSSDGSYYGGPAGLYVLFLVADEVGPLTVMRDNFPKLFVGSSVYITDSPVESPVSTPEPASVALLALGVIAAFCWRPASASAAARQRLER
jgi:hypothetical protein